ncbi:nitrite reductase/ring-hydroxylating ferredoxin subunit [Actinomycetospora succinea]|uniref:Nitrite reductase/ring-hydroxylating ferredoxin subunit n=1 Tax=Actinomycetospora succinea TaxID=663603 RepID=A0A4V3D723_9PSEU|nr:Rieske (2Fe-2S) protein [Actinomycetospora succinea]TDQ46187.1 nitrite reductase/ring-hydroxylating ferredoxin subunit [Actinomycetospora succinea]
MSTTTGPDRRTVLCGLAVALAAPGALAACSSGEAPSGGTAAPAPAPGTSPGAAPTAGGTPVAQIPVGGGTIATVGDREILLVQPTAGQFKGFDASCPHQGTTVDPPENGVITCPNHFSQFDAATGALRKGPADTGLTEVPVTVVDGTVQVS